MSQATMPTAQPPSLPVSEQALGYRQGRKANFNKRGIMVAPKAGTRERVFVLTTYLRDDNGDMVEGTPHILAGTSSDKVAKEVLETFKKFRNGTVTMVHDPNQERFLPGALADMLEDKPEPAKTVIEAASEHEEGVNNILGMVDFG